MILNEKTSFYKVCFNSMQVGIIVFDDNLKIVLANNPAGNIFGYTNLLDKNIKTFLKDYSVISKFISNPYSDEFKSTIELIGINKKGEELYLEFNFGKMEYEGVFYYKALVNDISARKLKENEISHLNIQLEEEVKLSNNELKKVIKQLKASLNKEKELNNLKTKFIELTSHEFKTPLSAILTSTELMSKYSDLNNLGKKNKHLKKVKFMIAHLNNMLDDLLTLENIEAGNVLPNYEVFELKNLIAEIKKNSSLFLKKTQKINLKTIPDEKIFYDPKIINIILTNLLNNAIKYSGENSTIYIAIQNDSSHLHISITDEGIGIPKDEQKLIFNRFFRAKNAQFYSGTGIGLNIVKGYVDSLKGTISFQSNENKGTVFNVKLPKLKNHEKKSTAN